MKLFPGPLSGTESPMLFCDLFLNNERSMGTDGSGDEGESVARERVLGLARSID
jgi:hypothetical protein